MQVTMHLDIVWSRDCSLIMSMFTTPSSFFPSPPPTFLQDNLFEWHFTIQGPQGTEFEGGRYHGRILLPTEYPMKPPSIILMTVRWLGYPHLGAAVYSV